MVEGERIALRKPLSLFLIGAILLCPFVCQAEVWGASGCAHEASSHSSAPDRCPDDGNNCICQGAVCGDAIRIANPDLLTSCFLIATLSPILPHLHAHLTWDGSPTGQAGLRSGLIGRAFLQNFRC